MYRYDIETGLYYLNSRYYNPEWGRFLNADGQTGEPGTLLSHNMFAYCMNNPVNMEDPSGQFGLFNTILGVGMVALGVVAIMAAAPVILPALSVGLISYAVVGAATVAAGAATIAFGASTVGEGVTGYNIIRDGIMRGNSSMYYTTESICTAATTMGLASLSSPPKIPTSKMQTDSGDDIARLGLIRDESISFQRKIISQTGDIFRDPNDQFTLKYNGNGGFNVINGNHRFIAAVQTGLSKIRPDKIFWDAK